MIRRLKVDQVAEAVGRHPVTVRKALEAGDLHGTQQAKGGRWSIRVDCAEAWADGEKCVHRQANVTPLRRRAS